MKTKSVAGILVFGGLILNSILTFAEPKATPPKPGASVSTAHEKTLPTVETNALVFVELTKAELYSNSRHSGLLPLIDFTNQFYLLQKKQGISRSRGFWRTLMKQANDKYAARTECADANPVVCVHEDLGIQTRAAEQHALRTLLEFLPATGGDDPVPALNELRGAGPIAVEIIRQAKSPKGGLARWERADSVIRQLEEIARSDADFTSAYNLTFGQELGILVQVSAEENLLSFGDTFERALDVSTLPDLEKVDIREMRKFANAYLQMNLEADGTLSLKLAELRDRTTDMAFDLLMKTINAKRLVLNAAAADGNKRPLTLLNSIEHRLFLQTAGSTFSILSGLTETLSPRSGFAANALSAASTTSLVSEAVESHVFEVSEVPHATARVGATTSLVKNFAAALDEIFARLLVSPPPDQLSLDQLNLVGRQTLLIFGVLKPQIVNLDPALALAVTDLETGAGEITAQLAGIPANTARIQAVRLALKTHLDGLDSALVYLPSAARLAQLGQTKEISRSCLDANSFLSESDFVNCVRHFKDNGTVTSRDTLITGDFLSMFGSDGKRADVSAAMFATLGDALTQGIWANIQPLSQFAAGQYADTSLTGSVTRKVELANAVEWSTHANHVIEFASAHSDLMITDPNVVQSSIDQFLATGGAIDAALLKLGQKDDRTTSAIYGTLEAYRRTLRESRREVHEQQLRYEAQPALNGYSLDTDATNTVSVADKIRTNTRAIGPCDRSYRVAGPNGQQPLLVFPTDYADKLPNGVHLAERLGIGRFEVCYERVSWVQTRQSLIAYFIPGTPPGGGLSKFRVVSGEYSPEEFNTLSTEYLNDGGHVTLEEKKAFGVVSVKLRGSVALHSAAGGRRIKLFNVSVQAPLNQETQFRSTVFGANIDDLKKRTSADPNEWINTFPAGRGIWANENIGEGLNGRSALEDELMKRWAAPSGLADMFSTNAVPTPSSPGIVETDHEVEKVFLGHRTEFVKQLDDKFVGGTKLSQTLKDLAGTKALLRSYLTLAFPNAMQDDDELKSNFSSAFGLPEAGSVLKLGHGFSAGERAATSNTSDEAVLRLLEQKVDSLVQSQNTRAQKDRVGFIAETLSNLALFKESQLRMLPTVPVQQALENLKRKVEAL